MATRKKQDLAIIDADCAAQQMEFRKANEAIGLRVVEGRLTLLNRKVFNVLMFHAQQLKTVGANAPINTPSAKKYFWVPLSELARDARYDSKDTQFLKEQIEEMQNIKLRLETDRQWTSERLIASVTFVNPKGLNSRAGQVWVGFAFPPEVHENVMSPDTYTKLSIFYQGLLRSGASLALYEVCRRYATNPSKVTFSAPYEHWYSDLTGNPIPSPPDELPEYKYFKRDVLKPAIAEVNSLTDIEVELIEHKKGRRVEALQFRVEQTRQPQLDFPSPPVIDVELLERIMRLGVNQQEAQNILAQAPDAKIRTALAAVDARTATKGAAPLNSPAAYFRWALKNDHLVAGPAKPAPRLADGGAPKQPSMMERYLAARAQDAIGLFKELDDAQRADVFTRFAAQAKGKIVTDVARVLDHGLTRTMLSTWYAEDLWGQPTAEDLAAFAEKLLASASPAGAQPGA